MSQEFKNSDINESWADPKNKPISEFEEQLYEDGEPVPTPAMESRASQDLRLDREIKELEKRARQLVNQELRTSQDKKAFGTFMQKLGSSKPARWLRGAMAFILAINAGLSEDYKVKIGGRHGQEAAASTLTNFNNGEKQVGELFNSNQEKENSGEMRSRTIFDGNFDLAYASNYQAGELAPAAREAVKEQVKKKVEEYLKQHGLMTKDLDGITIRVDGKASVEGQTGLNEKLAGERQDLMAGIMLEVLQDLGVENPNVILGEVTVGAVVDGVVLDKAGVAERIMKEFGLKSEIDVWRLATAYNQGKVDENKLTEGQADLLNQVFDQSRGVKVLVGSEGESGDSKSDEGLSLTENRSTDGLTESEGQTGAPGEDGEAVMVKKKFVAIKPEYDFPLNPKFPFDRPRKGSLGEDDDLIKPPIKPPVRPPIGPKRRKRVIVVPPPPPVHPSETVMTGSPEFQSMKRETLKKGRRVKGKDESIHEAGKIEKRVSRVHFDESGEVVSPGQKLDEGLKLRPKSFNDGRKVRAEIARKKAGKFVRAQKRGGINELEEEI